MFGVTHDVLVIGQMVIVALLIVLIAITARNYKIGKLIIRDRTIMFVEIETDEDYQKLTQNKNRKFKLVDVKIDDNKKEGDDDVNKNTLSK